VLAVSRQDAPLVIAAGSEIDPDVLISEVNELERAGYSVTNRLMIDSSATVIELANIEHEQDSGIADRSGSTAKGVGSARALRMMRDARTVADIQKFLSPVCDAIGDTAVYLHKWIGDGGHVILEGTQGYGLGVHTKYYPNTTSADCRAIDFLAQAGVNPWQTEVHVWIVFRPNPIRIAGNSGPLQGETTWEDLNLDPELTTVTRKTRRVGEWDPDLVNAAIVANGGPAKNVHLVLSMLDHLVDSIKGHEAIEGLDAPTLKYADAHLKRYSRDLNGFIELVGTGPRTMMWCQGVPARNLFGHRYEATDLRIRIADVFRPAIEHYERLAEMTEWTEPTAPLASELELWWTAKAQDEVKPLVDKMIEYGGHGAAMDLIDIGRDLFRIAGRTNEEFTEADATELGIYFYLRGKMARWTAAVSEGRRVSDDTLHDIGIYVRMAQRAREVGGWPYGSDGTHRD
jgi:adenylosuccinate synthase